MCEFFISGKLAPLLFSLSTHYVVRVDFFLAVQRDVVARTDRDCGKSGTCDAAKMNDVNDKNSCSAGQKHRPHLVYAVRNEPLALLDFLNRPMLHCRPCAVYGLDKNLVVRFSILFQRKSQRSVRATRTKFFSSDVWYFCWCSPQQYLYYKKITGFGQKLLKIASSVITKKTRSCGE